jgi:ferredoxin
VTERIHIDRAACDGYANCVFVAPEMFDLDDENIATLLVDTVTDENRAAVELAIGECPMRAISVASDQPR